MNAYGLCASVQFCSQWKLGPASCAVSRTRIPLMLRTMMQSIARRPQLSLSEPVPSAEEAILPPLKFLLCLTTQVKQGYAITTLIRRGLLLDWEGREQYTSCGTQTADIQILKAQWSHSRLCRPADKIVRVSKGSALFARCSISTISNCCCILQEPDQRAFLIYSFTHDIIYRSWCSLACQLKSTDTRSCNLII